MLKLLNLNPHFAVGDFDSIYYAEIAQSVEQRTENPRVDGSIPPLGTTYFPLLCKNNIILFICLIGIRALNLRRLNKNRFLFLNHKKNS